MRTINVNTITENIKDMCIQANHFLADDMDKAMKHALETEEAPLGRQILDQLQDNLKIAAEDRSGRTLRRRQSGRCHQRRCPSGIRRRILKKIRRRRSDHPREYQRQHTGSDPLQYRAGR